MASVLANVSDGRSIMATVQSQAFVYIAIGAIVCAAVLFQFLEDS